MVLLDLSYRKLSHLFEAYDQKRNKKGKYFSPKKYQIMDQNVKSTTQALITTPIEDNKHQNEKTQSKRNLVSCHLFFVGY